MWHIHLWRLLVSSSHLALSLGSSTGISFLWLGLGGILAGAAINTFLDWNSGGRNMAALRESFRSWRPYISGLSGFLVVWLGLYTYAVARTVYIDHLTLAAKARQVCPICSPTSFTMHQNPAERPFSPRVTIHQRGRGNSANPGIISAPIGPLGPCSVIQAGGQNNTAAPVCNPDPDAKTTQYFCNGGGLTRDPRGSLLGSYDFTDGLQEEFGRYNALGSEHKYKELLELCQKDVREHPNWPTSLLYCSVAKDGLGDRVAAGRDLKQYKKEKGRLVDASPSACDGMEKEMDLRLYLVN